MKAEILTGPERRRRWSLEEKARIVSETMAAGTQVSEIARRHGVSRSLIYGWRRELRRGRGPEPVLPDLVPVIVSAAEGRTAAEPREQRAGVIEIVLAGGTRITVRGRVDGKALQAVMTALRTA